MAHAIKNFFVTGPPKVGKSTLIEGVVRELGSDIGGFITKEVLENGERRGFEAVTLDGETAMLADIDIESEVRVSKYGVDLGVIDSLVLPAIRGALDRKPVVLIDEIANMEMASDKFCDLVTEALNSDKIVLAAIHVHSHPFTDALKERSDVQVFELTPENRDDLKDEIVRTVKNALGH